MEWVVRKARIVEYKTGTIFRLETSNWGTAISQQV